MELTFLGTGAGLPSKERNVSAIALSLLQELNSIWLFDCGEATQHQILRTTIKPRKINKIFITHLHGDHIYGLPGLLSSRSFQGGNDILNVYGPEGIKEYITTSLKISGTHLTYPLQIEEITEGKIIDEDKFTVYAKKLDHGIQSFGYRIIEKDKPGELLVKKLKEIGIQPGPIYQAIKESEKIVTDDGKVINRQDFIGPNKKGRIITIFGDTRTNLTHQLFVEHSDVLVHEATFMHDKTALAHEYFHSTTTQAAQLAANSSVKRLILTHISSRYQQDQESQILAEAKEIFPETILAKDYFTYKIDHSY